MQPTAHNHPARPQLPQSPHLVRVSVDEKVENGATRFTFIYVCVCPCKGQKKALDPLEPELQVTVSCWMWGLGTELGFSEEQYALYSAEPSL